jgi:enoyl-[acyl-carrier protein] reductase I
MIDMKGKVAVVLGVANKRSIAYAIAEKLAGAGATLVLCYQSERLKKEAEELIESLGQTGRARAIQLDVTRDEELDSAFAEIAAASRSSTRSYTRSPSPRPTL